MLNNKALKKRILDFLIFIMEKVINNEPIIEPEKYNPFKIAYPLPPKLRTSFEYEGKRGCENAQNTIMPKPSKSNV